MARNEAHALTKPTSMRADDLHRLLNQTERKLIDAQPERRAAIIVIVGQLRNEIRGATGSSGSVLHWKAAGVIERKIQGLPKTLQKNGSAPFKGYSTAEESMADKEMTIENVE